MICGNNATGLVFLNMTEGKMIQMIPEHPQTPLLQLNGERGFVFCDSDKIYKSPSGHFKKPVY
jgi:hypothetical protein